MTFLLNFHRGNFGNFFFRLDFLRIFYYPKEEKDFRNISLSFVYYEMIISITMIKSFLLVTLFTNLKLCDADFLLNITLSLTKIPIFNVL